MPKKTQIAVGKRGGRIAGYHMEDGKLKPIYVGTDKPEARIPRKKNKLRGGLSDKKSESSFDPIQLANGIKVEMEHTSDPAIAKEIAMDHLTESPDYYRELAKMEKKLKRHDRKVKKELEVGQGSGGWRESHQKFQEEQESDRLEDIQISRSIKSMGGSDFDVSDIMYARAIERINARAKGLPVPPLMLVARLKDFTPESARPSRPPATKEQLHQAVSKNVVRVGESPSEPVPGSDSIPTDAKGVFEYVKNLFATKPRKEIIKIVSEGLGGNDKKARKLIRKFEAQLATSPAPVAPVVKSPIEV